MERRKSRVQCLDRAMDILEALARKGPIGVTALAGEVGLHVATVHNILTALVGRNYVLRSAGRYRLGPALAALASQSDPLMTLSRLAQPRLAEITRRTGESAIVSVLSGERLVVIAATASADGLSCPAVNQAFPSAMALATGRVLVAHRPEQEWAAHVAAHRQAGREGDEVEDWAAHLRAIRDAGECLVQRGPDSGSIAVPVQDAAAAVVAALGANSISRLADAEHMERWMEAVREAGRAVSLALGCPPGLLRGAAASVVPS